MDRDDHWNVSCFLQPLEVWPWVLLAGTAVRAVTTGRQHGLADQPQPPPPQLPPLFPLTRFRILNSSTKSSDRKGQGH